MQKAREEAAEYSLGSRESPSSNGVVWLLEPGWQSPGVTEATEAVVYNPGEGADRMELAEGKADCRLGTETGDEQCWFNEVGLHPATGVIGLG